MDVTKKQYQTDKGYIRYEVFDSITQEDFDQRNGLVIASRKEKYNTYYDESISGFAHYYNRFVHIDEFVINESCRNSGEGQKMLLEFIEEFKEDPIVLLASALPKCYSEFHYENKTLDELTDEEWDIWCKYQERLIKFYEKCGFVDIAEFVGEQCYAEQKIMARVVDDKLRKQEETR